MNSKKFLFYDLEYASCKGGACKICEFGYVLTDEKFNIIKRDNLIINPFLDKSEWDYRVLRTILTRTKKEYESNPTFPHYYKEIQSLLQLSDYIVGHSLNGDAKAINDECNRYDKPSFDYVFYDVKLIYKDFSNTGKDTSLENILKELNITRENKSHDAETDAYNTMLELKSMLDSLDVTFEELFELCPGSKDETSNYVVKSTEENRARREFEFKEKLKNDATNYIESGGYDLRRHIQFLDNVKPNENGSGKFKGKKLSFSKNYEKNHFSQSLNLIQMIVNEGGSVILKASLSDIFVRYETFDEKGELIKCLRHNYVNEAIEKGKQIEIMDFSDLLIKLGIKEEQLDSMPTVSFDFLLEEDAIIKNPIEKQKIKKTKRRKGNDYITNSNNNVTIGDLYGDVLKNLLQNLDEDKDKDF